MSPISIRLEFVAYVIGAYVLNEVSIYVLNEVSIYSGGDGGSCLQQDPIGIDDVSCWNAGFFLCHS